jgi:hypothetical protein
MREAAMMGKIWLVLACCVAGCGYDGVRDDDQVSVEKRAYRTGSNIPVSKTHSVDGVSTLSGQDLERMQSGSAGPQIPNSGAGGR